MGRCARDDHPFDPGGERGLPDGLRDSSVLVVEGTIPELMWPSGGCQMEDRPADCVMFGTSELGVSALEAFNKFATDEGTQAVPAILIVDPRQKEAVIKQAKLADHRVVITLPLKLKQLRAMLIKLLKREQA